MWGLDPPLVGVCFGFKNSAICSRRWPGKPHAIGIRKINNTKEFDAAPLMKATGRSEADFTNQCPNVITERTEILLFSRFELRLTYFLV